MRKQLLVLFSLLFLTPFVQAKAQVTSQQTREDKPTRAEVLVLGTYHMSNPGRDVFNMQADDVLSPKRQQEIEQLLAVLKKFQPTKIAIESDPWGPRPKQYEEYVAGKYSLTRNEIDQVGFRLAKELGHKKIYPVDADGEFPYQRVVNYAKASGRSQEFEAVSSETGAMVKAQNDYLASHSILEMLVRMNSDESVAQSIGLYYKLAQFGESGDWAGADLVADWFRRNMRIYLNVVKLIDAPNERILVIYGAGHLGWLQHSISSSPNLRLRKLAEFVK
jgi:hypothetical protein